jgi:integrase
LERATGLRPSEVVNLQASSIILKSDIPHVKILPDGRRLKTADSRREIPLVGAALAALRERPDGFARYRDKSSNLSATLNKYLMENNLRPTKDHTVYSLRLHSGRIVCRSDRPSSIVGPEPEYH